MSEPIDLNAGVLAPVADEANVTHIDVTGTLPDDLDGLLIRNGPNPFDGRFVGSDMLSWWVAPSMLHGLSLGGGTARWYRNRWVRSGHFERHRDPTRAPDPRWDQNANVNVVEFAGQLLALGEGGLPFEIDRQLGTVGPTDLGGALGGGSGVGGMTAHPKLDAVTGELCFFRSDWQEPFLRHGVLGPGGERTVDQLIDVPGPAMMHDFAITETKSILLDLNVAYDFAMLDHGAAIPLRWHDDRVARLGVLPRHGGEVRWVEVDSCFIQHVVNAYDEDGDTVVLDVVRYPSFLRVDEQSGEFIPNPLGVLWRYRIVTDPSTGSMTVREQQLDDRFVELPRINEQRSGRRHRFVYTVEQPTSSEIRGIVRYDLDRGGAQHHHVPPGDQNSEPIFVPRGEAAGEGPAQGDAAAEDDGWVIAVVYRAASDTSDVVVLDAGDLAADPVATVHLPRRIPAGFHGTWVPFGGAARDRGLHLRRTDVL